MAIRADRALNRRLTAAAFRDSKTLEDLDFSFNPPVKKKQIFELARRHPPAALVVECTFTSLVDVARVHYPLLPVNLLLVHRYESARKVPELTCPKLFIHGRDDELIPFAQGRVLYEAAAAPKQFMETPGGHNEAGFDYSDEHLSQTRVFLDAALNRQTP